jgi:hypothetical protein
MEPLASAIYVEIAASAVLAVLWGAAGGALAWLFRLRLLWGVLLTAGGYLAQEVLFGPLRLRSVALIGLPPLILALLTSWLAARCLERRAGLWRRIGTALAALACGLALGSLCLMTGRLDLWAPSYVGLAGDACLLALLYLSRKRLSPLRAEE